MFAHINLRLLNTIQVWEEKSPLRFIEKDEGPVNIEILFASRAHGDGEPFDGRGM